MRKSYLRATCLALFLLPAFGCRVKSRPGTTGEEIKGELTRVEGVRVLRLWGSPREQGYAHGRLLAREIRDVIDGFVSIALMKEGRGAYERLAAESRRATVPEACASEMRGLVEGMRAALGEEARSKVLQRPLDYELALVANSLPDWACSSFAAWGEKTRSGGLIAGRNLDYPVPPVILSTQIVIVREGSVGRLAWMNVGVPGLVGVTTAVNEGGFAFFLHDADGLERTVKEGFMPRGFALRNLAEELPAAGAIERARDILSGIPTWRANSFLICGPAQSRELPAGVIEYDGGLRDEDGHATLRTGIEYVCCTNHYRLRLPPEECPRYEKLVSALDGASGMDLERAREIIGLAGVSITIHTLVFDTGSRTLLLSMGRTVGLGAHRGPFARLRLDELFRRGD